MYYVQGYDALPQTKLDEQAPDHPDESPIIKETKGEDENTKADTKRSLKGYRSKTKQSFGDLSLELAKLHVSYIFG